MVCLLNSCLYVMFRSCFESLASVVPIKLVRAVHCGAPRIAAHRTYMKMMKMKMNLFGYTYKIYDIGYKLEMMSKECNAGDPLETPGGLYRGPPSNENTIFKNMCMPNIQFKSVQYSFTMNVNQYSSSSRSVSSVLLVGFGLYDVLRRVSMAGCRRLLGLCGCGLKQITTNSSIYSFI